MKRVLTGLSIVVGVFVLLAITTPAAAEPIEGQLADRVRAYVSSELEALGVPAAAVAIVRDDEVVFAEGFGEAGGVPVTARTPFDLASVSKSLTALAVLQLVEAGALGLDDTLRDHVDWIDDAHPALGNVTIRDLLGHASGWTIDDGQANLADTYAEPDAIERNVRRLARTAPTHPRGTFEYSNANYDVLAYLIEIAAGVPFAEYMAQSVFEPLDMADAHVSRDEAEADGLAQGYVPLLGVPVPYEVPYVAGGVGSGFLHASAEDIAHTLVFHLDDGRWNGRQVLGTEWVRELHHPTIYADSVSGYAGGLWVFPFWPAGTVGVERGVAEYDVPMTLQHEGDHSSTATAILILPEERWGVAVLLPMNDSAAPSRYHQLDDGIAAILLGFDPPATAAYEDFLLQHVRSILAGVVALQVVGIAVASRRLRRWRTAPNTAPAGTVGVVGHVVLPGILDIGVAAAAWWMYLDRADAPLVVGFAYAPDVVLLITLISVLSVAWGAVRTIATVRLMRRDSLAPAEPEPAPVG